MQLKQLERVLYFEAYIVIEPGLTPLEKYQLLTEDELLDAQDEYGEDAFSAGIGAEAVKQMLMDLDLEGEKRGPAQGAGRDQVRAEAQEDHQAAEGRRELPRIRATARNG